RSRFKMETYIKMSFVLVVYLYLLNIGWSYLLTKIYPEIFKFIKKGMSDKKETRVTGMRVLLKLHYKDNYVFKAFNIMFIAAVLIIMYDNITTTKSVIATIVYLAAHLIYTTVYMLIEYISIRNLD